MTRLFRDTDTMHWEGPGVYGLFRSGSWDWRLRWHWRKVLPSPPPGTENVRTFDYFDKNPLPVTEGSTSHNDGQDSEFSNPLYSDPEKE